MRPIGFSTGALAFSDFRRGLAIVRKHWLPAIELSALRDSELFPLLDSIESLELSGLAHIAIHAPSRFEVLSEQQVAHALQRSVPTNWPIVVHPDVLENDDLWQQFGARLCIENMDKRKPIGRNVVELDRVFSRFPDASLCYDIGHARQIDPTMGVARDILIHFGSRLRQVHISEVNARSGHEAISFTAAHAFRAVAHLIPESVPIIHEGVFDEDLIENQIRVAANALTPIQPAVPRTKRTPALVKLES